MRPKAFPITVIAGLISLVFFGYGVFVHATDQPIEASRAVLSKSSAYHKKPPPKASKSSEIISRDDAAFDSLIVGELGLLLTALSALAQVRFVNLSQFETMQRFLADERKAWEKKQSVDAGQRDSLIAQLAEAQQKKAELDSQRQSASRHFEEFFHTLPIACFCFSAAGKIIRWNAACEVLYGVDAAKALQSTLWDVVITPSERAESEAQIKIVMAGESLFDRERQDRGAAQKIVLVRSSMVPLRDSDGRIIGVLSASIGVNSQAAEEREFTLPEAPFADTRAAIEEALSMLTGQAISEEPSLSAPPASTSEIAALSPLRDAVTGLWGYRSFQEHLQAETERAARYHQPLSLIILDLDDFGAYNRSMGFEAGDLVLASMATLLESKVRMVDVVARLGADEFALILPETGQAGVRIAVERILSGIQSLGAAQHSLTACVGFVVLTPDIQNASVLYERAQGALTEARSSGADRVVQYGVKGFPLKHASAT